MIYAHNIKKVTKKDPPQSTGSYMGTLSWPKREKDTHTHTHTWAFCHGLKEKGTHTRAHTHTHTHTHNTADHFLSHVGLFVTP